MPEVKMSTEQVLSVIDQIETEIKATLETLTEQLRLQTELLKKIIERTYDS